MLLSLPRIDGEDSREIRALELHAALGRHIRQLDEDLLFVPSSDGKGSYLVQYGGSSAVERCNCMDFQVRGHEEPCKRLLMVGIDHAARRRRRRPHTFECSSCLERLPLVQAVVVHEEQSAFTAFLPGELVCGPCGRSEGVI